jgi:hypothetical protein
LLAVYLSFFVFLCLRCGYTANVLPHSRAYLFYLCTTLPPFAHGILRSFPYTSSSSCACFP